MLAQQGLVSFIFKSKIFDNHIIWAICNTHILKFDSDTCCGNTDDSSDTDSDTNTDGNDSTGGNSTEATDVTTGMDDSDSGATQIAASILALVIARLI